MIPVDDVIQQAFEEGEPIVLYVVGGKVTWSRVMDRDFTGELDLHFRSGGLSDGRVSQRIVSGEYNLQE